MGGGKGGGPSVPKEVEDMAKHMRDIGEEQYQLGLPLMQLGGQQALEMLQTGSTAALEPAISATVESVRSGQSEELRGLEELIAKQGITGTAAQEALAKGRMSAESAVANVPSQFTLPFLQQIGGPVLGLTEQGMGSIGEAGRIGGLAAGPGKPSAASGALSGLASGASMGASFGPYGAAIGAVAGGLMGGLGSK